MDEYCFVIQPFDNEKFDKRYHDIFKPAIEATGLSSYRVDEDESVEIPIDTIEEKIKSASICLADITLDTVLVPMVTICNGAPVLANNLQTFVNYIQSIIG